MQAPTVAFREMREPALTDAEIVVASVTNPAAFAALFDRHYDIIAAFLRRRLDPSLAEELAAETFLQAFDARERYEPGKADAKPWLFGIASHLLSRHRRTESRRFRAFARALEHPDEDPRIESIHSRVDAAALAAPLAAGLAALSPEERDVVLLYAWTDLTYEQIGQALHTPVGTVRSRLHRARRSLRLRLESSSPDVVIHPSEIEANS